MTATEALAHARANLAAHAPTLAAAQLADTTHREAAAAALAHQAAVRVFGAEPIVPEAVKAPAEPATERPTDEAGRAAAKLQRDAAESVGSIRVATQAVATAKAARATADKTATTTAAEARRIVALVAAIRQAPSVVAAQQLALLGDLGPVGLAFPAPTETDLSPEPAILTHGGLPIRVASAGQKLLAGLHLSLAVRRAAGMPLVPIFVEDWGRYDGGATPGPDGERIVYVITTPKGTPLTVTPTAPTMAQESE